MCVHVYSVVWSLLLMIASPNSYRCFGIILITDLCPGPFLYWNVFSTNAFLTISPVVVFAFWLVGGSFCKCSSFSPTTSCCLNRTPVRVVQWYNLLVMSKSRFKAFHCSFWNKTTSWMLSMICVMRVMCVRCLHHTPHSCRTYIKSFRSKANIVFQKQWLSASNIISC